MDDLIKWLRAQLDEDEQTARAAAGRGDRWDVDIRDAVGWGGDELPVDVLGGGKQLLRLNPEYASVAVGEHIARHDPARVLREVEAKRAIIAKWELYSDAKYPDSEGGYASAMDDAVALLATAYSDRPGYLEEWRP